MQTPLQHPLLANRTPPAPRQNAQRDEQRRRLDAHLRHLEWERYRSYQTEPSRS